MNKLFLILINIIFYYPIHGMSLDSINKIDELGRTHLIYAAENDQIDIVETLLKKGADINAQCNSGWTALMWASKNNNLKMVNILLDHDCDITLKNSGGHTAKFYTQDKQIELTLIMARKRLFLIKKMKTGVNLFKKVQSREIGLTWN